jgi:predicted dehydrogenase
MRKLRCIAVIGTGVMARAHCRAIQAALDARILCAGRDAHRVRELANGIGGVAARSIDEALTDPQVEAVIVASDPRLNADLGLACIARGKPVLLEKPATLTSRQCDRLVNAALASGITVAVGHVLRCADALIELKSLIDEGRLGAVRRWSDERLSWRPECERRWWRDFPLHLLGFQGIHGLDLASWMMGALKFNRASWSAPALRTGWINEFAIDFTAGGIEARIHHSFRCMTGARNRIAVRGDRCAEVIDFRRLLLDGEEILDAGEASLAHALRDQDARFIGAAIGDGQHPACSIAETLGPMCLIETALSSRERAAPRALAVRA